MSCQQITNHPRKSAIILIPPKLKDSCLVLNVHYNDELLNCNDSAKYLGVKIDNELNFQPHITRIENKDARAPEILCKVRFLFPSSLLLQLYYALIHPHFLFGFVL